MSPDLAWLAAVCMASALGVAAGVVVMVLFMKKLRIIPPSRFPCGDTGAVSGAPVGLPTGLHAAERCDTVTACRCQPLLLEALASALRTQASALDCAHQISGRSMQAFLDRLPDLMQQSIHAGLSLHDAEQARRDEAMDGRFRAADAMRNQRHAGDIAQPMSALRSGQSVSVARVSLSVGGVNTAPASDVLVSSTTGAMADSERSGMSARSLELLPAPLLPPLAAADDNLAPLTELSDEEIDALPPELPKLQGARRPGLRRKPPGLDKL